MNVGLVEPEDCMVLTNRLLDLLYQKKYTLSDEPRSEDLEEILMQGTGCVFAEVRENAGVYKRTPTAKSHSSHFSAK